MFNKPITIVRNYQNHLEYGSIYLESGKKVGFSHKKSDEMNHRF